MLRRDEDSDIYYLSYQLCHGRGAPFHKHYINSRGALAQPNAVLYLLSKLTIGWAGECGEVDRLIDNCNVKLQIAGKSN